MIKSFKHKGLKLFFTSGSTKGIKHNHAKRLRLQLARMNVATQITDLDIQGYYLHQLKGKKTNFWSIRVSGNWRITFIFESGNAHIVNYEDYH